MVRSTREKLVKYKRRKLNMSKEIKGGAGPSGLSGKKSNKNEKSENNDEQLTHSDSESSVKLGNLRPRSKKNKNKKKKSKVQTESSDDTSDDDGKKEEPFSNKSLGKILLKILMELKKSTSNSAKRDAVRACQNLIIPFSRTNIGNFIDSVKLVLKQVGDDQETVTDVLNYAKQRVVGSNRIENIPSYSTIEEFENDLFTEFKPQRDEATLHMAICSLVQGEKEDVTSYSKRTEALKHEFGYTIRADASKKNLTKAYTLPRLANVEEMTITKFYIGLKPEVLKITKKRATTLSAAIEDALGAEANCAMLGLMRVNAQKRGGAAGKSDKTKPNFSNKNSQVLQSKA